MCSARLILPSATGLKRCCAPTRALPHWCAAGSRLGELHAGVPPVEPPPELFERIRQRLDAVSPGQVVALDEWRRRALRWRNLATAMSAVAAVLVALLVTSLVRPDLVPS